MDRPLFLHRIWRPLDPQLMGAAWAGEHLIARVRLYLLAALATIPAVQLLMFGNPEAWVGLTAIGIALGPALLILVAVRWGIGQRWMGFVSSIVDVTVITAELIFFIGLGYPHLVVNNRVIYPLYFLTIAATALRYDARICLVTGATAIAEYFAVISWTVHRGFAGAAPHDAARYGIFEWDDQFARGVILLMASLLAAASVARSRELLQLSSRDRLTGLLNRGALDQRLREELQRSRRQATPLAVALLDLDAFKRLNDTWGHLAGDEALRTVAATLQHAVRIEDVVSRYGGEEFAIVFPALAAEHATPRLELVRTRIATTPALAGRPLRLTVSIGLAVAPGDGSTAEELLACADERLYIAKGRGKNSVVGPAAETAPEAPARV